MDWRELHLTRRSRAFNFAHRWMKVVAIILGFPATTLSLMALFGRFPWSLNVRLAVAVAIALAVPAIVSRLSIPKGDPLVAVGQPSETYALLLLGFAVVFVIGLHSRAQPLLLREGDRASCEGMSEIARVAWFLGGVRVLRGTRTGAAPCGPAAMR
jgi:hypothetical protein